MSGVGERWFMARVAKRLKTLIAARKNSQCQHLRGLRNGTPRRLLSTLKLARLVRHGGTAVSHVRMIRLFFDDRYKLFFARSASGAKLSV